MAPLAFPPPTLPAAILPATEAGRGGGGPPPPRPPSSAAAPPPPPEEPKKVFWPFFLKWREEEKRKPDKVSFPRATSFPTLRLLNGLPIVEGAIYSPPPPPEWGGGEKKERSPPEERRGEEKQADRVSFPQSSAFPTLRLGDDSAVVKVLKGKP
ncbi:neural Wiskott-Aldrich syndrome protein-like [Ananas comosus]|uniref:Neural Wiskott-Aldrich syndrome protein-like n=1 Tax=Ananas comosus TaxID=4615 RepID=A0A6P5EKR5_ANACO|nr:neural Wiskott-Aldrich syndrome protein-like [Ananas comosus]